MNKQQKKFQRAALICTRHMRACMKAHLPKSSRRHKRVRHRRAGSYRKGSAFARASAYCRKHTRKKSTFWACVRRRTGR